MLKKYFIILFFPLFAFTAAHKYYVSITQIEYAEDKKEIQIVSRIFIDDFESLLQKRYDKTITLDAKNESEIVDAYIKRYLLEKIRIVVNNKTAKLDFIGKEYKDDIMYCYLEIKNVKKVKSFEISNKVLFDLFDEQQNIVRTKINDRNKSFIFTSSKYTGTLNFQ